MFPRIFLMLVAGFSLAGASINSIDIQLFASDEFVQYEEGYIRGPGGLIDLTGLRFEAVSESLAQYLEEEQDYYEDRDEAVNPFEEEEEEEMQMYSEQQEEAPVYDEAQPEETPVYNEEPQGEVAYNEEVQIEAPAYIEEQEGEEPAYNDEPREAEYPDTMLTNLFVEPNDGNEPAVEYYEEQQEEAREYNEEQNYEERGYNEDQEEDNFEGGYDRRLEQVSYGGNQDTSIDIVVFPLKKGSNRARGINWAEHGVGKRSADGQLRWCCNEEAVELGLCQQNSEEYGKLLVSDKFEHGAHLQLAVPQDGFMEQINSVKGKVAVDQSATYIVLYANCNAMHGRNVNINGSIVWKSKHGYLPGELYGFLIFYAVMTAVYIGLYLWFSKLRKQHKKHNIEIERWILLAITLGMTEMIFRTVEYHEWNYSGHPSTFYVWIGIVASVLKQGISRCVMVMVSMGWGVVRDTMDAFMHKLVSLTAAYIIVSLVLNTMILFAVNHVNTMSYRRESEIFDFAKILGFFRFCINVLFMVWVVMALDQTITYLQGYKKGTRKLERMMQLRMVFLVFVGLSVIWALFSFTDRHKEAGIIQEEHAWAKDAGTEFNYLLLLVSIAILWRPNANAKEYSFVMESGEDESFLNVPTACNHDDEEVGEEELLESGKDEKST